MNTYFIGGPAGSGKTFLANLLSAHLNIPRTSFGDVLRNWASENDLPTDRPFLQDIGYKIYTTKSVEGYLSWFLNRLPIDTSRGFIMDGIRHPNVWQCLTKMNYSAKLIYCETPTEVRKLRIVDRDGVSFEAAQSLVVHELEKEVTGLKPYAASIWTGDNWDEVFACL